MTPEQEHALDEALLDIAENIAGNRSVAAEGVLKVVGNIDATALNNDDPSLLEGLSLICDSLNAIQNHIEELRETAQTPSSSLREVSA